MRFILPLAALLLLAGCSNYATVREAWHWEPARTQGQARVVLPPEQLAGLTQRLADLQMQRKEIRSRISGEPDIWMRQRLYAELHQVGRQLSPLERQLAAAAPAR